MIGLLLLAASVAVGLWVGEPLGTERLEAAPAAQASPAATRQPSPTRSLEDERLRNEIDLLFEQRKQIERQRDTDAQPWRAPAEAVAAFGPTLVGLGLLALAWRALSHFLPPRPERPRPAEAEVFEEDEDDL